MTKGVSNIISVLIISMISFAILSILLSNIQTLQNIELIEAELERSKQSIRYSEDISVVYRAKNSTHLFLILKNCGRFDVDVVEVRLKCGNYTYLVKEGEEPINFSIPSGEIYVLKINTSQCEKIEQVILRTEHGNIFKF